MKRRSFLQTTGAALAAGSLISLDTRHSIAKPDPRLSVQLYTIRDEIERDLEGAINKISKIGFKYVETAFWPKGVNLDRASAAIRNAGLQVSSCHVEVPEGNHRAALEETAKAFNCTRMIWHGWPEDKRYSSLQGTRDLIKSYNEAAAFAKTLGLTFGLHNHWWEFRNKVDGKPVYEYLLKETDASIFFELDTYWVKVAGLDPAEVLKQFGSRAKLLHVKDGPARYHDKLADDNVDPMTAVGKGTQDVPAIITAAAHADFFVVEMDKVAGDVFSAVKESYDYLHGKFGLM